MSEDEAIPLTRSFAVDEGYASRATVAMLKRVYLRRPGPWVGLVAAVIAALLGFSGIRFIGWVAVFLIVMWVVTPVLAFFRLRGALRRQMPPGTVIHAGYGPFRFVNQTPTYSTTMAYGQFSDAHREGEFVVARNTTSRQWHYFPGALFGDEDLARFPRT